MYDSNCGSSYPVGCTGCSINILESNRGIVIVFVGVHVPLDVQGVR